MISASLDLKVKVHKESGASLFLASPAMMQRCDNALYVEQYLSDNAPDWMAFVQDKFGIDVKARNKGLMLILGTMKTTRCVAMSFPQRPKRDVEGSGAISVANFIGGKLEVDSKSHSVGNGVFHRHAPPTLPEMQNLDAYSASEVNTFPADTSVDTGAVGSCCVFVDYVKVRVSPSKKLLRFLPRPALRQPRSSSTSHSITSKPSYEKGGEHQTSSNDEPPSANNQAQNEGRSHALRGVSHRMLRAR